MPSLIVPQRISVIFRSHGLCCWRLNTARTVMPVCKRTISSQNDTRQVSSETKIMQGFYTIPNMLTLTRIAAAPLIGSCILSSQLGTALGLFVYSCVTDLMDGYLARKFKMQSVAGTILDPMADKFLMLVTTLSLSIPGGPQIIPAPVAGLIIGRDVLLAISAIYLRFISLRRVYGKVTWGTYWDFFKYPSAVVRPTKISKWNTFLQMLYLGCGVIYMIQQHPQQEVDSNEGKSSFQKRFATIFDLFGYLVSATTIMSGASYIFSKNAVTFLKNRSHKVR
ncbi:LAMI_0E11716g1_1 [Lachancea mirantina]|uniref:LAMI_0E11716g1_1 n=1 Tax=Lachancea mirantina TaxID=1230905 RepID=A0A1G4JPM3_9SACH|nr:LAMI_0E11716g1_1 [Lachancea mirantina]